MSTAKRWALAEVLAIFGLVMVAIWFFQQRPVPFAAVLIAITSIVFIDSAVRIRDIRFRIPKDIDPALRNSLVAENIGDYTQELGLGRWRKGCRGWRLESLDFSWVWRLACLTAIGLALILIAGYFFKPEFWLARNFWDKKIIAGTKSYIWWGLIQQLLLQGYVTNKLYAIFAKNPDPNQVEKRAAFLTALASGVLFFCAHIPNPTLMIVTPIAGAATAYVFLNCRNVYLLGIAHGILGNAIGYCLANSLRIGPHYWQ